jgi:hypothetical protein
MQITHKLYVELIQRGMPELGTAEQRCDWIINYLRRLDKKIDALTLPNFED